MFRRRSPRAAVTSLRPPAPRAPWRAALAALVIVAVRGAAPPSSAAGAGAMGAAGTARYIVQLADPPLAVRPRAPKGMRAAARAPRWAPPDGAYRAMLRERQDRFVDALQGVAPGARATYHYDVVFDGVTVRLTPEQASAAARLPGVVAVTREQPVEPLMDASLPLIGAPRAWADARIGGQMRAGRGVRIAIIDSGITAAHPFFSDGGFTAPEGFPRSTVTVGDKVYPYPAEKVAEYTNKKVIVARTYANPENVAAGSDPTADYDPLAKGVGGFHGAHVAGTAAGISLFGGPNAAGAGELSLSGVAPGAYLMAYKFSDAYTPEILRMIDDAVADGADVINNSWGTALMNIYQAERHPVAVAFKNAHDAGVVVVAAAGNAGANGEATLGGPHQMIPEVITVANSETGRGFAYYLYARDAGLPAALTKHPAAYETFGNAVTKVERPAYKNDLCNLVEMGLVGRGKIQLGPWEGACATQSPLIPIPLPAQFGWVTKLINAATVQADAVVFYTSGDTAATAVLLQGIGQLLPLIASQLPAGFKLPPVAIIGGQNAADLAAYAETHPSLQLTYDLTPESVFDAARVDVVNTTSARGPAPDAGGASFALKPDLAAPGTNILSTNTDPLTGAPAGFTTASGTSMASPHVTGAAAVVRQVWPDWTPDQVKAALLETTSVSGKRDGGVGGTDVVTGTIDAMAPATEQGAGRLDLAAAIDPQVLIAPPSVDFGTLTPPDASHPVPIPTGHDIGPRTVRLTLTDVRLAPEGAAEWTAAHAPGTGPAAVPVTFPDGDRVTVAEGGAAAFRVGLDPTGLAPGEYDGRVVFTRGARSVHVTYRLRVAPAARDILLVNVRRRARATGGGGFPGIPGLPGGGGGGFDDGPDNGRYWTAALDTLGRTYDVWTVAADAHAGAPPLSVLQGYRLVIVAGGDGNVPLDRLPGGMTSLQMYLLGGGRMLLSGTSYNHALSAALDTQNSGAMLLLSRYFAGFDLKTDNAALKTSLTPERLFGKPIRLSAVASPDAGPGGGVVDLGAPLASLRTQAGGGQQTAPDTGLGAVGVADRIFPYVHSFLAVDGGGSAMTGVTADASLEQPTRAAGIPWRALFAGFNVEAVATGDDTLTRAEVLGRVWDWATEADDITVEVTASPAPGHPERIDVRAAVRQPDRAPTAARWRWDAGDGRPFVTTADGSASFTYNRAGRFTIRAEMTTADAHTYVGEAVAAGGRATVYLPALRRMAP